MNYPRPPPCNSPHPPPFDFELVEGEIQWTVIDTYYTGCSHCKIYDVEEKCGPREFRAMCQAARCYWLDLVPLLAPNDLNNKEWLLDIAEEWRKYEHGLTPYEKDES